MAGYSPRREEEPATPTPGAQSPASWLGENNHLRVKPPRVWSSVAAAQGSSTGSRSDRSHPARPALPSAAREGWAREEVLKASGPRLGCARGDVTTAQTRLGLLV